MANLSHGQRIIYEHFEYHPTANVARMVPGIYLETDEGRFIYATDAYWIRYFIELGVSPFINLDEEETPAYWLNE